MRHDWRLGRWRDRAFRAQPYRCGHGGSGHQGGGDCDQERPPRAPPSTRSRGVQSLVDGPRHEIVVVGLGPEIVAEIVGRTPRQRARRTSGRVRIELRATARVESATALSVEKLFGM
jgi:hypothetical protein